MHDHGDVGLGLHDHWDVVTWMIIENRHMHDHWVVGTLYMDDHFTLSVHFKRGETKTENHNKN